MILGIHLNMLIGSGIPLPAPATLVEAIKSVQVTHKDEGRSGFQITFEMGKSGPVDFLDYPLLLNPLIRPFSRVVLTVIFNAIPRVLIDGIITNRQMSPGSEPGAATLTLTGEDVSVMMDMKKERVEHPAQDETIIANKIIVKYLQYGLIPMVIPPLVIDPPIPIERTPVQQDTDLGYLNTMAAKHGYTFYVIPGPAPLSNMAYWGPPQRLGIPQRALSINMGPQTNVESINFQYNGLAPTIVSDEIQDRLTNQKMPVQTFVSTRLPLVSQPALPLNLPNVRSTTLDNTSGLNIMQAMAKAQGITDKSVDNVVTASGEMDALNYGDLLQPRNLVGLRGAGYTHDGIYYVKSVTHNISPGKYKQNFNLTREGDGAITPVVIP